ncbi:extracellular solute-binding protein [Candidatus Parcubacteria bacterium]|nr:extracellular solute-binding protein [Candidatus Parcubacteria bacterium]
MSKFQIILLTIFGVAIVAGVLVFSLSKGSSKAVANVTIWGPVSITDFQNFMNAAALSQDNTLSINYVEISPENFDEEFTGALAEGRGPDLVIVSQDQVWQERNKLTLIPFSAVKQSDFDSTFIDEGRLLTSLSGIYALPLFVDPLVLYTNRDLLNSAAIAQAPKYWDELYAYADKLTIKDAAGNIKKSAIALGEATNIPHAKDILSLLMLQAGTPITDMQSGGLTPEFTQSFNLPVPPGEAALDFYTQFANPAKPFYSWNRSLSSAQTNFVSGDSALYIGFASELPILKAKNPNLSVGVTPVLQSRVAGKTMTYGKLYGIALVRTSRNQAADLVAATKLASGASVSALASVVGLPPARRDLLSNKPGDGVQSIFYDAAIQSKGWLDPNPVKTKSLFADMITSVTSGRARSGEALSTADGTMRSIIESQ